MTLCEENCEFKGYDTNTKKAICSCQIKIKLPLISDISFDKEQLYKNFMNINNVLNLNIMKCYKVLLNKKGFSKNIGALFVIPIICIHIASIFIFYTKGMNALKKKINKIIDIKLSRKSVILKNDNEGEIIVDGNIGLRDNDKNEKNKREKNNTKKRMKMQKRVVIKITISMKKQRQKTKQRKKMKIN